VLAAAQCGGPPANSFQAGATVVTGGLAAMGEFGGWVAFAQAIAGAPAMETENNRSNKNHGVVPRDW